MTNGTKSISAAIDTDRFRDFVHAAQKSPVHVAKKGRVVGVFLSGVDYLDFERFREVEDRIWGERAEKAAKESNWLGPKKSEAFLKKMRDARD